MGTGYLFRAYENFDILLFLDQVTENTSVEFAVTVVEAMELYESNVEIQTKSCSAIQRLARKKDAYRRILLELGVGRLIIQAVKRFPFATALHESACASINNLCITESNRQRLMSLGAGTALQTILTSNIQDCSVLEKTISALKALAYCEQNREPLMALNIGDTLLKAMIFHQSNIRIQEQACGAFHCLTHLEDYREELTHGGLGEALISAMFSFPYSVYLQENAAASLTNLSFTEECAKDLIRNDVGLAIMQMMKTHLQQETCQLFGVLTLLILSCHSRDNVDYLIKVGAATVVEEAMCVYPSNNEIQIKGQELLTKFVTRCITALAA